MSINKQVKEYLKYSFTEKEKAEISKEMAQLITEKAGAEDEKKAIASKFKSQIDGLDAAINAGADKIRSGYEYRQIACEAVPVDEKRVWEIFRLDTGEKVKTRKMTADELQLPLLEGE